MLAVIHFFARFALTFLVFSFALGCTSHEETYSDDPIDQEVAPPTPEPENPDDVHRAYMKALFAAGQLKEHGCRWGVFSGRRVLKCNQHPYPNGAEQMTALKDFIAEVDVALEEADYQDLKQMQAEADKRLKEAKTFESKQEKLLEPLRPKLQSLRASIEILEKGLAKQGCDMETEDYAACPGTQRESTTLEDFHAYKKKLEDQQKLNSLFEEIEALFSGLPNQNFAEYESVQNRASLLKSHVNSRKFYLKYAAEAVIQTKLNELTTWAENEGLPLKTGDGRLIQSVLIGQIEDELINKVNKINALTDWLKANASMLQTRALDSLEFSVKEQELKPIPQEAYNYHPSHRQAAHASVELYTPLRELETWLERIYTKDDQEYIRREQQIEDLLQLYKETLALQFENKAFPAEPVPVTLSLMDIEDLFNSDSLPDIKAFLKSIPEFVGERLDRIEDIPKKIETSKEVIEHFKKAEMSEERREDMVAFQKKHLEKILAAQDGCARVRTIYFSRLSLFELTFSFAGDSWTFRRRVDELPGDSLSLDFMASCL